MKRLLLIPAILVLLAFSAHATHLRVDGGVLQGFRFEARFGIPIADAGDDLRLAVGDTVTLDGTASTDPDGDPLTYVWKLTVPSASTATLDDVTSATPGFIADVIGTYTAELTVGDGRFVSLPDTVIVTAMTELGTTSSTATTGTTTTASTTATTIPVGPDQNARPSAAAHLIRP